MIPTANELPNKYVSAQKYSSITAKKNNLSAQSSFPRSNFANCSDKQILELFILTESTYKDIYLTYSYRFFPYYNVVATFLKVMSEQKQYHKKLLELSYLELHENNNVTVGDLNCLSKNKISHIEEQSFFIINKKTAIMILHTLIQLENRILSLYEHAHKEITLPALRTTYGILHELQKDSTEALKEQFDCLIMISFDPNMKNNQTGFTAQDNMGN